MEKEAIKTIQIIGERHSGTNWWEKILKANFDVKVNSLEKHWFISEEKLKDFYPKPRRKYQKVIGDITGDDHLITVIIRNPYDWLLGMRKNPHHCHCSFFNLPMEEFIRKKWNNKRDETFSTPCVIKNVVHLRAEKYRQWLNELSNKNVYYLRYEDLFHKYDDIITNIKNAFNINNNNLKKIGRNRSKSTLLHFNRQQEKTFSSDDIIYIRKYLDPKIESIFSYGII